MDKAAKNSRILDMYVRLCEGKLINKSEETSRFSVEERLTQRDVGGIKAFLDD